MAFKINDGPVSKAAIMNPDKPGPTSLPALKFAEFSDTAFRKSSFATNSELKLCLTGASIAPDKPKVNANI